VGPISATLADDFEFSYLTPYYGTEFRLKQERLARNASILKIRKAEKSTAKGSSVPATPRLVLTESLRRSTVIRKIY